MRPLRLLALVGILVPIACTTSPDDETTTSASDVVGGRAENGFPSVGYLAAGSSLRALAGPFCGATLIAPKLAVTAAHCIVMTRAAVYGVGFGARASSPIIPAKHVFVHPDYRADLSEAFKHDVAVLVLSDAPRVAPTTVLTGEPPPTARYVGYGRTTPGALERTDGYTGERKSLAMSIFAHDALNLHTRGEDGGLCRGDSGGPILTDAGEVIGVLGGILEVHPSCDPGNETVFTRLAGETGLLARGRACAAGDAAACACTYPCASAGYAEGQCNQGWRCAAGCVVHDGCAAP